MQGLFGTAPDQLGYSVFDDPATKQAAQQAAEVGFVGGGLLGSLPILGPALRGYGRLAAGQVNRAMMGEGGLLGPITPQPMYVVPPGEKLGFYSATDVGKVFPTSITNKSEVKNVADDFANQFKQMGFEVTLDHSGSKAGASSYLRVSDPTTGRFLNKPIRISDHSKGAKELDANINVLNPQEDFAKITSILNDMRAKGETLVYKQDKYAQELIANGIKPKTAYQRARTEIAENQPSPYPQQAALDLAQQRAALPVGKTGLPSPQSLTMPSVPTVEQMQKYGRTEVVPLSQAVSFQSARNWEKFKEGKGPGDLVAGYGDKPLALRLETGEYVIYDGNHRTDLALQKGQTELPMHVIDVKSYDPAHAGRKPVPSSMSDDELLRSLLGDEVKTPQQVPQETSPTYTDPFGNTIGSSIR
jgi:hypothetical protein